MIETKHLEVIFKTVEACNNKCSYCFYFNNNRDRHLLEKEKFIISQNCVEAVVSFLAKGVQDLRINHMHIIFHGGEPLLQKPIDFDQICSLFIEKFSSIATLKVDFGIQTNGTLINEEWIKIFSKYDINPSISIDGPKEYHNFYRKDHNGIGTYSKVVSGIKLVEKAIKEKKYHIWVF